MKLTVELQLKAKTLISYGFRPQQIKELTGINTQKIAVLTQEVLDNGASIAPKGALSANKILRTKLHYRQFSLWILIYKQILTSEADFHRTTVPNPWYSEFDCSNLIKTHIIFIQLLENEFDVDTSAEKDNVLTLAECYNILKEIPQKTNAYLIKCKDCRLDYIIIESSKQTDNCPFCHERGYEVEKIRIDTIVANIM